MAKQIVDGGPAFPGPYTCGDAFSRGMTLRDYFAGQALGQLIELEGYPETPAQYQRIATRAYAIADAMLEARTVGGRRDVDNSPEPPEFPVYLDSQGNEHAEF